MTEEVEDVACAPDGSSATVASRCLKLSANAAVVVHFSGPLRGVRVSANTAGFLAEVYAPDGTHLLPTDPAEPSAYLAAAPVSEVFAVVRGTSITMGASLTASSFDCTTTSDLYLTSIEPIR